PRIAENPTDGSRWIVKARPTPEPTFFSANPTDGSRWIVKVQPPPPPKGRTLNIHRLPSVGLLWSATAGVGWTLSIHRRQSVGLLWSATAGVGWTLSIHRLPSVGLAPELLRLILNDHKPTAKFSRRNAAGRCKPFSIKDAPTRHPTRRIAAL